jgi:hypothetical protein
MKICVKSNPEKTEIERGDDPEGFSKGGHRVACWLHSKKEGGAA